MSNDFNKLYEQYMLLDKKTLAELLALRDIQNQTNMPQPEPYVLPPYVPNYPSVPNPYPWGPYIGDTPWWPQVWYSTNTSQKAGLKRDDIVEETQTFNTAKNRFNDIN